MIIFINGSINAGKTTIANLLAKKLGKIAVVDIDILHEFIKWMDISDTVPLNLQNAVCIIRNFASAGLDIVIPYPLSQKNYEFITKKLSSFQKDIIFITLSPPLEVALQNRGGRELSKWEKDRIKHHYETGISNPKFGHTINNSQQTPEETVNQILTLIDKELIQT